MPAARTELATMGTVTHHRSDDASDSEDVDESTHDTEPTRDELFHVLRNQRRRFAIHHLKRSKEPVDVGDLATQVAAWENDVTVEDVTSEQRRRVYNALQQTHVPELDDTGLVETSRREVELTERAEDLDVYLEMVPGEDVPWIQYHLGIAGLGVAITTAVTLDAGPFAAVSAGNVAVFFAVVVLVSAAANYYVQHENRLGANDAPPEIRGE